jgi:hypothetical protein
VYYVPETSDDANLHTIVKVSTTLQKIKNVFIFRHYASPPDLPGSVRHHQLAKAFERHSCRPFIFPSNFHHLLGQHVHEQRDSFFHREHDGIQYYWLRGRAYDRNGWRRITGMLEYGVGALRIARTLHRDYQLQPNIVIGSIAHSFGALAAYCIARRNRAKYWLDIGDLWPEGLIKAGTFTKRHPLAYLFRWISDFLYRKSDLILVLNDAARRHVKQRGVPSRRLVLFPPGTVFDPPAPAKRIHSKREIRIVYTGSLSALYPLDEVILALAALTSSQDARFSLEIVGDGPDKLRLKTLTQSLCTANVRFTNTVTREKLFYFYQRADTLLVIEKDIVYGFPNKLIDYLCAAKPILLACENRYGLSSACAIHAKPEATSIYTALLRLASMSPEDRRIMGYEAFRHGAKRFDINRNFNELLLEHI